MKWAKGRRAGDKVRDKGGVGGNRSSRAFLGMDLGFYAVWVGKTFVGIGLVYNRIWDQTAELKCQKEQTKASQRDYWKWSLEQKHS